MPAPDTEPENYSIDQMMERLKSRSNGGADGETELVVREDGSKVYRVRKRKRRSHQPKKELEKRARRMRFIQVVIAVALVALLGIAFLGSLIYLNSSSYQKSIIDRIRTWTGAEAKIADFRANPISIGAGSLELSWPEGSALQYLKIGGLEGDLHISSLFSGIWTGSEITSVHGGTLVLAMPSGAAPALSGREGDCPFQFRYRIPKFNILFGGAESPAARITGTEASLVVLDKPATKSNLQLEGGQVSIPHWGQFGLDFASLQIEGGGVRLGNMRLLPPDKRTGEIFIGNSSASPVDLSGKANHYELRVTDIPLSLLTGPGFGAWITGEVSSLPDGPPGSLSFSAGEGAGLSLKVPFRALPSAEIPTAAGLPMFKLIAEGLRDPWYAKPRFDMEARGVVVRDHTVVRLEDLKLEGRGYIALTGSLAVHADGRMEGMIDVGLPEAELNDAGFAYRRTFHRHERGMAWALVRISGTRSQPQDNLASLLEASSTGHSPKETSDLEEEFLNLTTPPGR